MNNIELKNRLLLSVQRALLGQIYPSIRAIAVGFNGLDHLTIKMYLDKTPTDDDYENLSYMAGEILSDIEFNNVEELCEYSESKIDLNGLEAFVYIRKD